MDVYSFIQTEQTNFQAVPIAVTEDYEWSFYEHVKKTILYKNSTYLKGKDENRPFKNITRPMLNLQYRAEGFDVKDITLFIDDADEYFKSFLIRKYHDKWARENNLDTFIDNIVESYVDFGGVLVKDSADVPEVVPLQRLAFCDQTALLSGPICEKHYYAPDELKEMEKQGWGSDKNGATATIGDVIQLAREEKNEPLSKGRKSKTPGRYIEVYELHVVGPAEWLDDASEDYETPATENGENDTEYVRQLHIVCFYTDSNNKKNGITLFKGKEAKGLYKVLLRDPIYGRALGLGGAEELFESQIWINYDVIRMKGLLDAAAKVLYKTTDAAFANRNKTNDLESGEIMVLAQNTDITQVNTTPVNLTVFENSVKEWEVHAQTMSAATDSILGEQPTSGTPFKLQELVTQESHSLHEYRKGKIATFLAEIYRDWLIPTFSRNVTKGMTFLAELELSELQEVADNLVTTEANKMIKEKILNGQEVQNQDVQRFGQNVRDQFMKGGNKRFIEILKGEMADAPMDVEVNIAGKQKNLTQLTDKLTNVFRQIMAAPGILDDPRMAKIFNEILESSGLSPVDFYQKPKPQENQPANKVSESINFKDLPPEGKIQLAGQAGIKLTTPAPVAAGANQ